MSPEREYAYIKRKQRTDSGPIPWQSVSWRYPWQFVSRCRCVSISSSIVLVLLADPECERKVRVSANLSGLCRAHCNLQKCAISADCVVRTAFLQSCKHWLSCSDSLPSCAFIYAANLIASGEREVPFGGHALQIVVIFMVRHSSRSGMEDIGFDRAELVVVKQDSINKETPVWEAVQLLIMRDVLKWGKLRPLFTCWHLRVILKLARDSKLETRVPSPYVSGAPPKTKGHLSSCAHRAR